MRALLTLSIAMLGVSMLGACSNTYLGRMAMLRTPDVEDYRKLPVRAVPNDERAARMPDASDPQWVRRTPFVYATRSIEDPAALDAILRDNGTTAFLIVANGRLVDERYYHGYRRDSMYKSFSISKSVLSALFGIAQQDGAISAADRLGDRVAGVVSPALADARIESLLDNVSGLAYERGFAPWKQQPRMYYTTDVRGYVKRADSSRPAGQRFGAEDLSPLLVAVALEQALRDTDPQATLAAYTSQRLWQPMGAEYPALWVLDREKDGLEKTESGFVARAIDLARFGQLYLDGGRVGDKQLVPQAWVEASITAPAKGAPNLFVEGFHRKLWWGSFRPDRVRDDFYANGHFGQRIYVSPDKALVIVRMGKESGDVDWTAFTAAIADAWPKPASGTSLSNR
jgi:CubicO group peptidase (beta-lactamase class C family)